MTTNCRRRTLFLSVSVLFAGHALAAAQIEFVSGRASLVGSDGHERPLARGASLSVGDTIRVENGILQIRLADGTFVSLQPRTALSLRDASTLSLSAGAVRLVVPDTSRGKDLRIDTPAGKVDVDGSGIVQAKADGSTVVVGSRGNWRLSNASGSVSLPAGQAAESRDRHHRPSRCDEGPSFPPPPKQKPFNDGVAFAPAPASGYAFYTQIGGENFDGTGQPRRLRWNTTTTYERQPGSRVLEAGRDAYLAWGRWIGPVNLSESGVLEASYNFGRDSGLPYVVGTPTPHLPTSGSATYSLLGATSPIWAEGLNPAGGGNAPGKFSGSLSVNFGPAVASVGVDFLVQMSNVSYRLNGTTSTASANFFFQPPVTSAGGCKISCIGSVAGFFAGSGAQRVGVGYQIMDNQTSAGVDFAKVVGTAAFTK